MANDVVTTVKSQLLKVIEDLDKIESKAQDVSKEMKSMGNEVSDAIENNAKKTENFLGKVASMGRRAADQLRGDFKTLVSLNALSSSLKLSEQFKGAITETVSLSDSIRKLGGVFGIAENRFMSFQKSVTQGLGKMGLSSEVGARTMQGLSQSGTRVAGEASITGYSQTSGQLASVTRQQGSEGDIAKVLAQVIQSRGGDVNDMKQLGAVAEDVRRVFNATGQNATTTLEGMKSLFTNMSKDFREKISTRGLANLAATATVAGPNSTKFLEEFLGKSPIARQAMEAQGFKGVVGDQGLDVEKFKTASKEIMSRIGGDPRLAAQTLGLSEDAAEGFVRLAESLDRVKEVQDKVAGATGNLNNQYKSNLGLGEAFKASINRVKGMVAGPLTAATQGLNDVLGGASDTNTGALATVAGGGALAALLAGMATKGIGKGLGLGGLAKGAAIESATGRQVQPVYVVNASEIRSETGGLGNAAAAGGMMKGKMGKALGAAGGAFAAFELGSMIGDDINEKLVSKTEGKTSEGFEGNAIERLIFKIDKLIGGQGAKNIMAAQKVVVETASRDLKVSTQPTRGASH